jgi:antitoxin ParD1/3/4
MATTVSLGKYYEDYLQEKLKQGRYGNASEIVRAALRLLEEHERMLEIRERELDLALQAGLDSDDAGDHEEVMDRVLARFKARRGAKQKQRT